MKKQVKYILFLAACLQVCACARIKMPNGGQKDTTPPKMVSSRPSVGTTNFRAKTIEVNFDEYIVLDNASGKLIVSPPLKKKPNIGSKLKTLYVRDLDSLQDNTTYIFDFGDAITDYTEGNRLSHFSFIFSTGDVLDTMLYSGRLINAYTLEVEANKYVGLYKDISLQRVSTQMPDYITRTDSNGRFFFNGIKEGNYNVIAFEDLNQNMIFDPDNEGFAIKKAIELTIDTSNGRNPIVLKDTLLFSSSDEGVLNIESVKIENERTLKIITSKPVSEEFKIDFLFPKLTNLDTMLVINKTKDTISVYNLSQDIFDTVNITISDKDSFEDKQELFYNKQKNKQDEKIKHFHFLSSFDTLKYNDSLQLRLPYLFDRQKQKYLNAYLFTNQDTMNIVFYPSKQDAFLLVCDEKLRQQTHYTLFVERDEMEDFRNYKNDSLRYDFYVDSPEDYGRIIFSIKDSVDNKSQFIISLFDNNLNQIGEDRYAFASKDEVIFEDIVSGQYKIRIIEDKNHNGKWDKGSFEQGLEPEKVFYFPKQIIVKRGWDSVEEYWLDF